MDKSPYNNPNTYSYKSTNTYSSPANSVFNKSTQGSSQNSSPAQQQDKSGGKISNIYNPGAPQAAQPNPPKITASQPPHAVKPPDSFTHTQYPGIYSANDYGRYEKKRRGPKKQPQSYKWAPDEYAAMDYRSKHNETSKGFVAFCVSVVTIFSIAAAVALFAMFAKENDVIPPSFENNAQSEAATGVNDELDSDIRLNITAKPELAKDYELNELYSVPSAVEAVKPSVVSVITYSDDNYGEATGIGSGIILNHQGYIVTNSHVVASGINYKVQLYTEAPYDAELIGYDEATDLAVLKINAENLIPATFGDSFDLKVGETVIAIGNPLNLNFAGSVTRGVVSALNREVSETRYSINYIQTDAAINPGNSGGALANVYGQVIGINVAKIIAVGYEGIGFAIPVSDAMPIIQELIDNGRVTWRVKLGIIGTVVTEFDEQHYGWKPGVMIKSIDENSDLIGKDVQKSDIITHINGVRIYSHADIYGVLDNCTVGDTVELTIFRCAPNGTTSEFTVTVTLLEDSPAN